MAGDNPRVRGARTTAWLGLALGATLLAAGCSTSTGSTPATDTIQPTTTATASVSPAPSATVSAGPTVGPDGVITITSADVPMPPSVDPQLATDAPKRIVSLATGVGETLAALGVADRVVGRDETSDVPAIDAAPVVTKAHAVNAEKVLALKPDIVIVDDSTSPPEALDQIRSAGVVVVTVPEAWSLADIGPRTRAVAAAVGASPAAADAVVAEATGSEPGTASTTSTAPTGTRVSFLYLRGTAAVYLVGGTGSGADALIAATGGVDAGAEAGLDAFVPLTAEAVAAMNPDVLLVMTKGLESVGGVDGLERLPGVAQTTAGQQRRVIAVDDTLLLSFGPRTGELIKALSAALAVIAPPVSGGASAGPA